MLNYFLFTILASNIMDATAAPEGGYYRYIGPKWSKFARYYYPQQGYYFHYVEESERSQALKMPDTAEEKSDVGDIVDVAVEAGSFTKLVEIVTNLGLVETLKGVDSVTIFAPSDEAFAKIPKGTLENLTTKEAKAIIARHIIVGATVLSADFRSGTSGTFGGEYIEFFKNENGNQVSYNDNAVNVGDVDIKASNGVIHVIDAVLL